MQPSLRLGRVVGIEIGIHYTWLLIGVLIAASFIGYLTDAHGLWPARIIWSAAIVISGLFFMSVMAHELAHALVARVFGIQVRTITLFALGGVTRIEKQAATPAAEFWMGLMGPLVSAAIGMTCGWLGAWWGRGSDMRSVQPLPVILLSLSSLNLMLAVFNLIPGFPLDGGRILRAFLWWIGGDENRATRISARSGQGVALAMFGMGLWEFLSAESLSGIWLGLLGWFLLDAATASYLQAEVLTGLGTIKVGDLMSHECPSVPADLPLQRFADEYVLQTGRRCYAVEDGGTVVGMITPADLRKVDRGRWDETPVVRIAHRLHELRSVSPETPIVEALQTMGREDINQMPVIRAGRMEGMLSRSHILHALQTRSEVSM
ncbi:MAG TPA: site-2 protease family protein [Nitrospira sp.]|nr:site-2 protease family protein [Nitrospira sp.]